jgi:general stress protein 13
MQYVKGKMIVGTVSGVTKYGIFLSFDDYYTGLVHISEISNKFVSDINDIAKVGDRIYVEILEVDDINLKLKLSIKNVDYKHVKGLPHMHIAESKGGYTALFKKLPFWIEENLASKKTT